MGVTLPRSEAPGRRATSQIRSPCEKHEQVVSRRPRRFRVVVEILRNGWPASACLPEEPAVRVMSATAGPKLRRQGAGGLPGGMRPVALIHISPALPRGVTSPLRRRHRFRRSATCSSPRLSGSRAGVLRPRQRQRSGRDCCGLPPTAHADHAWPLWPTVSPATRLSS